jgi:uncharacterized protein with NRDE domain
VCLLIALSGEVAGAPLIVAANRDELYSRPSVTMTTLRSGPPRVLGGRDELAGGTWLAVNEHGVLAGLTNQPSPLGPDRTKRSRGELPLAFTSYARADEAVAEVCADLDPADYNPCWLLVGDRHSLFSVSLSGSGRPAVEELAPGVHILENSPLASPSAKTAQVASMVAAERAERAERAGRHVAAGQSVEDPVTAADALAAVLADHRHALADPPGPDDGGQDRIGPPAVSAACVHTPTYGTRSAMIVTVLAAGPPRLRVADGPPCEVPMQDVTALWAGSALV